MSGQSLNKTALWIIFQDVAGDKGSIAGFDFMHAIARFEAEFYKTVAMEKELVGALILTESRIHTRLLTETRDEIQDQTEIYRSIDNNVEKIANAKEISEKQRHQEAKRRYLYSLAKRCLNLPLSAMSDETAEDDAVTLDDVYIHLDTTKMPLNFVSTFSGED